MKFIHLSDLHIGKRVNEFSMLEDQEYILTEILRIIEEEKPDGVLIAGDVYDRSVPTEEAVKLWDSFLVKLAHRNVQTYAISGNHDSAVRFSNYGALLDVSGIHLSSVYDGTVKKYMLEDQWGAVNIYLLPFLKPAIVRPFFPDREIKNYTEAMQVAIEAMEVKPEERNILVCHQFVTGALRSDSEEVVVGGLDNVDAAVFQDFDYVALGHIHGKQQIGRETIRYCGTPLKYSFSEKNQEKSVTVVEIGEKTEEIRISEIPLKPMRDLREIRGTFAELTLKENYENTNTEDYIHAILTDEEDVFEALGKLRVIYPNIMKLSYDNKRSREKQLVTGAVEVEKKEPYTLVSEFYEMQNNQPLGEEQADFLKSCMEEIWGE